MIITLVPLTAYAVKPRSLMINGVDIIKAPDYTIQCGEGTAAYDNSNNILTLKDATINAGEEIGIRTHGSLTINLVGTNKIICDGRAIYVSGSNGEGGTDTLRFSGSGKLIIESGGDSIQADYCNIDIDGCVLDITSYSFSGIGVYDGSLTIQNSNDITVNSSFLGISAQYGMKISKSNVNVVDSGDYANALYAQEGKIDITGSKVEAKATSENAHPAIWGQEISISDNSTVVAESNGQGFTNYTNAVYSQKTLTVTDSSLEAKNPFISVWADGAIIISDSKIKTVCNAEGFVTDSLHSFDTITIKGDSDVLTIGGIMARNGVIISPADGELMDVKVGIMENGEEGTKHFKDSPYGETVTLDSYDLLGGYTYTHIKEHTHTGGTATCQNKAVCDDCGREYGEVNPNHHTGKAVWKQTATTHTKIYSCCQAIIEAEEKHTWGNGVCVECGYERQSIKVTAPEKAGQNTIFTVNVTTPSNVDDIRFTSEYGLDIGRQIVDVQTDDNGNLIWTIILRIGTKGDRTITVSSYVVGEVADQESFNIAIVNSWEVNPPVVEPEVYETEIIENLAAVNDPFTVVIKTSVSVHDIQLYNEYGNTIGALSKEYKDQDGIRTWTIKAAFGTKGNRTLSFKAMCDGGIILDAGSDRITIIKLG